MKKTFNDLLPGKKFNNNDLCDIFLCSPQGGMRRSHKTNTLVLICNHINSLYDDRWTGDTLLYTGMGTTGDQSFTASQNKTLFESNDTNIGLYLFEVFKDKEYTFTGRVALDDIPPYMEQQLDENNSMREVCIFPLKLIDIQREVQLSDEISIRNTKEKLVRKISSNQEIFDKAVQVTGIPDSYTIKSTGYTRNPYVSEFAKRKANGICQLCEQPAPFNDKKGVPYLESHHIEWLSQGGEDTITNTVALCPNCHVKMHIINNPKDVEKLKAKVLNTDHSI